MATKKPFDPADSPKVALEGRIVTGGRPDTRRLGGRWRACQ